MKNIVNCTKMQEMYYFSSDKENASEGEKGHNEVDDVEHEESQEKSDDDDNPTEVHCISNESKSVLYMMCYSYHSTCLCLF